MIALIIPVTGLLEVIDHMEPIYPETALTSRGNTGTMVTVSLARDHEAMGTLFFHVNHAVPDNLRARRAVVALTGAHIMVQGCAMFTDVPLDLMRDIVYDLSRKE